MDREWKQILIVVGVVAIVILGSFIGIKAYSGLDSSSTVVISGSMQHSDKSELDIIDTGDIIIMKNKDKGLTTYVEGYENGYKKFGEYGDVIIYNREGKNPVIHRAIVWLDYNNDGTYSAPSLNEKLVGDKWITDNGTKYNFTELSICLPYYGPSSDSAWVNFNAIDGGEHSGYLTKGDGIYNINFDCSGTNPINKGLVTEEQIKAVAGFELPWLGAIKLYIRGDTGYIQSNTPFCLTFVILDIIGLIALISIIWDILDRRYSKE